VQAAQAAPLVPHWVLFWLTTATQVLPLQHPAQLLGPQGVTQTPFWQVLVPVQAAQTAPLVPHWELDWPATPTQVLPLQQPVAQLVGPHAAAWQVPLWHVVVPVQAAQFAPLMPHWLLLSLATATQTVPLQQPAQLPGPQLAVVVQVPLWQVCVPVHATQTAPRAPHWLLVSLAIATQLLPLQQPVQLAGPQLPPSIGVWQEPRLQDWPAWHPRQAEPPRPHCDVDSLLMVMHVLGLLLQQPAQLAGPQLPPSPCATQLPPTQACVAKQRLHCPPTGPQALPALPGWQSPLPSMQPWQVPLLWHTPSALQVCALPQA
jgi:hypothetical protein